MSNSYTSDGVFSEMNKITIKVCEERWFIVEIIGVCNTN